jgi:hypothetical protein
MKTTRWSYTAQMTIHTVVTPETIGRRNTLVQTAQREHTAQVS